MDLELWVSILTLGGVMALKGLIGYMYPCMVIDLCINSKVSPYERPAFQNYKVARVAIAQSAPEHLNKPRSQLNLGFILAESPD